MKTPGFTGEKNTLVKIKQASKRPSKKVESKVRKNSTSEYNEDALTAALP